MRPRIPLRRRTSKRRKMRPRIPFNGHSPNTPSGTPLHYQAVYYPPTCSTVRSVHYSLKTALRFSTTIKHRATRPPSRLVTVKDCWLGTVSAAFGSFTAYPTL
uniref:Uncharacterized protein n=1 Tax=Cacopsylla melanoneura TaxID=428564 RepID=A0A8D8R030_9HEMI